VLFAAFPTRLLKEQRFAPLQKPADGIHVPLSRAVEDNPAKLQQGHAEQ
jgi:hypothetical protein